MNLQILFQQKTFAVQNIKSYSELEKALIIQIPNLHIQNIWYHDEEGDQIQVSNTNDLMAINDSNKIQFHLEGQVNNQVNNKQKVGRWAKAEDQKLLDLYNQYGEDKWDIISEKIENRSSLQCKMRYEKLKINKQQGNDESQQIPQANTIQLTNVIVIQTEEDKKEIEIKEKIKMLDLLKGEIQQMDKEISQQKQNHQDDIIKYQKRIQDITTNKLDIIDFSIYLTQLKFVQFVELEENTLSMLQKKKDFDELLKGVEKNVLNQFKLLFEHRIQILQNNYVVQIQNENEIKYIQKDIENNKRKFMRSLQQLNDKMRVTNDQISNLEQLIKSMMNQ